MPQIPNRILSVKVVTDLASEPVSASDVKDYGQITYSDSDTLITSLITVARQQLEKVTGRSFGVKTIQCDFAHSGCRGIRLPNGEVDSISVLYYKPCHLQPYADYATSVVDWRTSPTADAADFTLNSGDKFLGKEGYYMATYTTKTTYATEEIKTAIKAQTIYLLTNKDNKDLQGKIDPIALGLIRSIIPGDLML